MNIKRKVKIHSEPVFGFSSRFGSDGSVPDPTEKMLTTVTHLFGDRK